MPNPNELDYFPLAYCLHGHVYRLSSRNLGLGVYDAERKGFIGIRSKFGDRFLFMEEHTDVGPPYGTAYPTARVGYAPEGLQLGEMLSHRAGEGWIEDVQQDRFVPVIRRDLAAGEAPHGRRLGFEDLWSHSGQRLPDGLWPIHRSNKALFDFLDNFTADTAYVTCYPSNLTSIVKELDKKDELAFEKGTFANPTSELENPNLQ